MTINLHICVGLVLLYLELQLTARFVNIKVRECEWGCRIRVLVLVQNLTLSCLSWILFFHKVSLTLGCPMDLQLFPLDSQTCHISVASYGWTSDDVIYLWRVSFNRDTGLENSNRSQYRVVISATRTNQYTEKPLSPRRVRIGEIWSQQSKLFLFW